MKPLITNQRVLQWLNVCPADKISNRKEKLKYIAFSLIVVMCIMGFLLSSVVFFVKMVSIDLERSLFGLFQTAGALPVVNIIIGAYILRHRIRTLFTSLSNIYKICKSLLIRNRICYYKSTFIEFKK